MFIYLYILKIHHLLTVCPAQNSVLKGISSVHESRGQGSILAWLTRNIEGSMQCKSFLLEFIYFGMSWLFIVSMIRVNEFFCLKAILLFLCLHVLGRRSTPALHFLQFSELKLFCLFHTFLKLNLHFMRFC